MVSIKGCASKDRGLEIVLPTSNVADSYMKMAEESIRTLEKVRESKIWTATTSYYIFYYSLYALMQRIGIKCEIHGCSIEFMKRYLMEFYNKQDLQMFNSAFSARQDLQYYADRPVDPKIIEDVKKYCKDFFIKTKDIIVKIKDSQINEIRTNLKKEIN